jgi:SAM-dependent methyltransferase
MKNFNTLVSKLLKDNDDNSNIIYDLETKKFKSNSRFFEKKDSITDFFVNEKESDQITSKQETFYEDIMFPNYDGLETYGDLIDKSNKQSHLAAILDKQISHSSTILEVGCGTGQLSLFLKRFNRFICGIDLSIPSLKLAENFRIRNDIDNVFFSKMNIFNMQFKDEVFDYVISNGVLHHTYNTEIAFRNILKPLKKKGYIVIGLYHKYGRLYTNLRQKLIQTFGEGFKFLDKRTINKNISEEKRYAWLKDQYKNPFETSHTLQEVKKWFTKYDVQYLLIIPFENFDKDINIFENKKKEISFLTLKEMSMMFSPSQIKEGGFFVVIGKKN